MVLYGKCGNLCHFQPKKSPRLCPYTHGAEACAIDLKFYNKHLKNIFEAVPKVDAKPTKLDVFKRVGRTRLEQDLFRSRDIDRENKRLLQKIIEINRFGGKVDCFNKGVYSTRKTKWKEQLEFMRKIDKENLALYRRLAATRPNYENSVQLLEWKRNYKMLQNSSKFPYTLMKRVNLDETLKSEPSISGNLEQLRPRPYCFLDFQVENGEFLGRIFVELYEDYVPVTVNNFLSICRGSHGITYLKCPVHRIVKDRFLETGDITRGTGSGGVSIYGKNFEEEKHILKHTKAGVLSMSRVGNHQNNSKFCITFMNMSEMDWKNVVFGKVVSGNDVLMKISGYGRVVGKPLRRIYISECGELPYCNCSDQKRKTYECL